jgi:hypothetical protein
MLIWPFITLTLGLTAILGYVISKIEIDKVMSNWENRRCEVPIMTFASRFKPQDDPRTPGQFARDNFSFCMDKLVKEVTSVTLSPLLSVFSKQGDIMGSLGVVLNSIRKILYTIYEEFMKYLSGFFKRYTIVAQQIRIVTLHLKAAFERIHAAVLSLVFMGISLMRGFLNSIDFVFKVVLIILGIMVALIIILFFVLFPFIPMILSVITAIIVVAVGAMAGTAASYQGSFCFAPNTLILTENGRYARIKDLKIGDKLANNGIVESILQFEGKNTQMYSLGGIIVSGTHIVKSKDGNWNYVANDERSRKISSKEELLYCLNTSTHEIHILSPSTMENIIFKDWEEIESDDLIMQNIWNEKVLELLNNNTSKNVLNSNAYPAVSGNSTIVTPDGEASIQTIKLGDIVYDEMYMPTRVIGIVKTQTDIHMFNNDRPWSTNMIYKNTNENKWKRESNEGNELYVDIGYNLVTESGTFITKYFEDNVARYMIYRDFTEVGIDRIQEINKYVESRLRTREEVNKKSTHFTELPCVLDF